MNGRGEHREHKEGEGLTVSMPFMFYTAKKRECRKEGLRKIDGLVNSARWECGIMRGVGEVVSDACSAKRVRLGALAQVMAGRGRAGRPAAPTAFHEADGE